MRRRMVPVLALACAGAVVVVVVAGCSGSAPSDAAVEVSGTPVVPDGSALFLTYTASGGMDLPLGRPVGTTVAGPAGGSCQQFDSGAICQSPHTGLHIVWGEIWRNWRTHGGACGSLGYPVADQYNINGGTGYRAEFENGAITTAAGTTTLIPT